jgi:hypothetical protein
MYRHLCTFAVLPAPFSCCPVLLLLLIVVMFPASTGLQSVLCVLFCFLEMCLGFGLGLLSAGVVAVVLHFYILFVFIIGVACFRFLLCVCAYLILIGFFEGCWFVRSSEWASVLVHLSLPAGVNDSPQMHIVVRHVHCFYA